MYRSYDDWVIELRNWQTTDRMRRTARSGRHQLSPTAGTGMIVFLKGAYTNPEV